MYIKYELYRSKNQEMFNAEMIEWVLKTDKDLIEIDSRMNYLLAQHIQSLPEIVQYGIAYVGRMKLVGIEINDNDDVGGIDEEQFRIYMKEVMPNLDIVWNKGNNNIEK